MEETNKNQQDSNFETIVLASGCFWCTEAVYARLRGVQQVTSGYCNGHVDQPSYEQVCEGDTGLAECVELVFDPQAITLEQVLQVFFATHDPTTLNRQGNDVGTQYRSGIYTTSAQQFAEVQRFVQALGASGQFPAPIVTEVEPLTRFWPAEDYHQEFFALNPRQPYCSFVVGPKVQKFEQKFAALLK